MEKHITYIPLPESETAIVSVLLTVAVEAALLFIIKVPLGATLSLLVMVRV